TMLELASDSQFIDCAKASIKVASDPRFGPKAKKAVQAAWKEVGLKV
ncbi:peptidase M4 family protein, partial [Pseudomonas syringae]|nr:peptidase M4 family protein [Pseudomonas syringae]